MEGSMLWYVIRMEVWSATGYKSVTLTDGDSAVPVRFRTREAAQAVADRLETAAIRASKNPFSRAEYRYTVEPEA
jgi:hypothetical protein